MRSAEETVAALVSAYNARDAQAFAECFARDVTVVRHPGEVLQRSRDEVLTHYRRAFAEHPQGRTRIAHRVVLGSRVVDHEQVTRGPGDPVIDVVSINEVRDGLVTRLDFVSHEPVGA